MLGIVCASWERVTIIALGLSKLMKYCIDIARPNLLYIIILKFLSLGILIVLILIV